MLVSLKWGSALGAGFYVLALALGLLIAPAVKQEPNDLAHTPVVLVPLCFGLFVYLIVLCMAGYYASRSTGTIWSGTLAGPIAMIVSFILGTWVYDPLPTSSPTAVTQPNGQPLNLWAQIGINILVALLALGFGAMLAWMGAQAGARRYKLSTTSRQQLAVSPDHASTAEQREAELKADG